VGEEINLLTGYIVATSRLLPKPLHVLYQSSSAAGKTTLMKAVVSMMPPEVVLGYSSVSPKALQYMQDRDLRHSIFLLEEDRRLDDAAREIIKLLKSEGRASSAVTIKDPQSGMMRAVDFVVDGPMAFLMTTTALVMDEEQSNRDLVCSADESKEQTARILDMQRMLCTIEGRSILDRRAQLRRLHQNAQRLLQPLTVINPHAKRMTFPAHAHRLRRDHEKYLGIIEAVTLLHQYQREIRVHAKSDGTIEKYIEVTIEDIETANRIAASVLGRSLDDCPPHTRTFLEQAMACVEEEAKRQGVERETVRLTAVELAKYTGLSVQMVRRHLSRLMELELAYVDDRDPRNEKRHNPFRRYVILASSIEGGNVLSGLIDSRSLGQSPGQSHHKGQSKLRRNV
jgi:DNA-binding transcriptional ArsR family regulator